MSDQTLNLFDGRVCRSWRRLSDLPLAELPRGIGINVVARDSTRANPTPRRQIMAHRCAFGVNGHCVARSLRGTAIWRDYPYGPIAGPGNLRSK